MPDNAFLTPSVIARRALATLYNETVLLPLVHRDFEEDFNGKQGHTVNVRVPLVFEANEFDREEGIIVQDAKEDHFPVKLDKLIDVSFGVTPEEMLLEIEDFSEQLLNPAMEAISLKVDRDLAIALTNAANQNASEDPEADYVQQQDGGGIVSAKNPEKPSGVLISARTVLSRAKMPSKNRRAVYAPEGAGALLEDPVFHEADKRGDTDGLIEAAIGRKFGFDSYETQVLGESPLGEVAGLGFHKDAVTIATRLLPKPLGKVQGQVATASYKGLGIRVVYGYDMHSKEDVVSLDCLYGTRAVRPQGAVELDMDVEIGS